MCGAWGKVAYGLLMVFGLFCYTPRVFGAYSLFACCGFYVFKSLYRMCARNAATRHTEVMTSGARSSFECEAAGGRKGRSRPFTDGSLFEQIKARVSSCTIIGIIIVG